MRILVCDDDEKRCGLIVRSIKEGTQTVPKPLAGDSFTDELKKFYKHVTTCLRDPANSPPFPPLEFNGADILVLDDHLGDLKIEGARPGAEQYIDHIRLFTSAKYIVSLNKLTDVDFDLLNLVGDHETRADIALNTRHLTNPGLWDRKRRNRQDPFLPWYWPQLNRAPNIRQAQIDFVLKYLDEPAPVLDKLGFEEKDIDFLSDHAGGALSSTQEDVRSITFRQVFTDNERSPLSREERDEISNAEEASAAGAGKEFLRHVIARDVAARMALWFRRDVAAPQEPFVDVPHLLIRFPFFLGKRAKRLREWNNAPSSDQAPYGLEPKLYEEHLAKAEYKDKEGRQIWVPNPCFSWAHLKADEKLSEYFFNAKEGDWADVVFCEDRSEFLERTPADGDSPIEFAAQFKGSWTHRYVSRIDPYQYSPRAFLARGE